METNQINISQNKDNVSDEKIKAIEIYTESKEEFPIDFDEVWSQCGFSTKGNASSMLKREFKHNEDYQIFIVRPSHKKTKGGRPSHQIRLSVECAKAFVIMAGTTKGKEIRKYIGMNNSSPLIFNP